MDMAAVFERIYTRGEWGGEGSGIGSAAETTLGWRNFLAGYLRARRIRSVVDLGCGDWQIAKLIDWTGIDYLGIDCVPEVISTNEWCYGTASIRFVLDDITTCSIPPADLVIVKDVLQHWPNDTVAAFLERLAGRRALICNDSSASANGDIELGGYRPVDIAEPPFSAKAKLIGYWTPGEQDDRKVPWCKVVHELEPA